MLKAPIEFAVSSNGDKWFVEQDEATGDLIVIHRANIASGGTETRWSVSSFLEIAGDHPQGQTLREVLRNLSSSEDPSDREVSPVAPKPLGKFPWDHKSGRSEN